MAQKDQQIKVIAVGDTGVGKSSLLLRFINNQFDEFQESTLGAAFISKVHQYKPGKRIRFQMWDTAGQEKYKSIASIYYKDAQVALCLYDITSRDSFVVLKKWVQELKSKGPQNILIVVVGNKIDKSDKQQVTYSEAKQYAQKINAVFKLTSAKEGKGVDELFTTVAEKLHQQVYNIPFRQTVKLEQIQKIHKKNKGKQCKC